MNPKTFYFCVCVLVQQTLVHFASGDSVDLKDSSDKTAALNPKSLQLSMKMDSDNINLNLTRNNFADSMTLVILGKNGVLSPWNEQRSGDYAVYQDPSRLATILVQPERSNSGDILRQYQGTFKHKDEYYYLRPESSSKRRRRRKRSGDQYVVTKVPPANLQYGPQMQMNITMPYSGELLSYAGNDRSDYIVEMLIVVDYSIYKAWYDLSAKKTDADKRNDAINGIRYYYAQIANGVDLRYASINERDFGIRVRLVGYYIATTAQDSVWTEASGIRMDYGGYVYSDAYKALDAMQAWISQAATNLPTFDQATLFTKNVLMAGTYDDNTPRSISGLANIEGICGTGRVSVNKEAGEYSSTETSAHEMGHNLGAQHDGLGNTCDGQQQYIMSSAAGTLTDATFLNPYRFSTCSIEYFRRFLGTLKMMNTNCLLQTNANLDPTAVDKSSKVPPGQFIDIDRQCQLIYGPDSFYCGGNTNDKTLCSQMWCYDASLQRCVTKTELRAANGTTCGNKRWCVMGRCTNSASAPVASDFCLSGDYRGDVIDCRDVISKNPGRCYEGYINETCCASCQAIRDQNPASCPYGDGDPNYCRSSVDGNACYDDRIQQQCCATCKTFLTDIPDCRYGDKATWCPTSDRSVCYNSLPTCCTTCYYRYTGYQDCPYGDKAGWCQTLPKGQCADSSTAATCCISCNTQRTSVTYRPRPTTAASTAGGGKSQTPDDPNCRDTPSWCSTMPKSYCYTAQKMCCKTCKAYYKNKAGCEYGNRFSWCPTVAKSDCKYLENQSDCCEQCSAELDPVDQSNSTDVQVNQIDVRLDNGGGCARLVCLSPLFLFLFAWFSCLIVQNTV